MDTLSPTSSPRNPNSFSNMTSAGRKSQYLGMSFGTACGKLRKQILFHLLQKHGENICFNCKQTIDTCEELSIEHMRPWEGRDRDLFWDLNNIAFSHLKCNKPHTLAMKQVGPDGTAWCIECKQFLPIEDFPKLAKRWNGLHCRCKQCRNARERERYHRHKSK